MREWLRCVLGALLVLADTIVGFTAAYYFIPAVQAGHWATAFACVVAESVAGGTLIWALKRTR